jgi:hypothetical protein
LITSSAVLGRFNRNDTIVVQFAGCWDECASGLHPSWLIKNVQLSFGTAAKATTFEGAATATLHGETMGVNYQWQRNDGAGWVNIPLATAPAYRFFPVAADFNATFRLVASVLGKSITSQVVRLTTGVVEPPEVSISVVGGQVTLQFTGRLQSAAQVNGPYTDVAGAQSPYVINPPAAKAFFRSVR